ncbi:hypothetical protein KQX54_018119 [Cotesia glomerata]|uniref:Uncharacterized protein n=1 Tax=Cotesia glomerata TaxID=32391 RepID=A0AAV7IEM9_COTGL|nr:hypothetical protein KQX54_018119 [Cotesia glomerata]
MVIDWEVRLSESRAANTYTIFPYIHPQIPGDSSTAEDLSATVELLLPAPKLGSRFSGSCALLVLSSLSLGLGLGSTHCRFLKRAAGISGAKMSRQRQRPGMPMGVNRQKTGIEIFLEINSINFGKHALYPLPFICERLPEENSMAFSIRINQQPATKMVNEEQRVETAYICPYRVVSSNRVFDATSSIDVSLGPSARYLYPYIAFCVRYHWVDR